MKNENYYRSEVVELIRRLFAPEDNVLIAGRRRAAEAGLPPIELAPEDGALLGALVALVRPRLVVEIGTLFGYSAIWIARHLDSKGHLVTIEANPAYAAVARHNLENAGLSARVEVREGTAIDVLVGVPGPVDLVFIDADKVSYPEYLTWSRRALRPGGLVVADNAFRHGEIVEPKDDSARAIRRFLEVLASDPAWVAAMVPTLEGMAIGVRTDSP